MKINLREDGTEEYVSLYRNYLENIQNLNAEVSDVFNEVMMQTRYERLQRTVSDIIDGYQEMIVDSIETEIFETWQGSGGSLKDCLGKYCAGDAACAVGGQVESQMQEISREILKIQKDIPGETATPVVSEEGLDKLEEICRRAGEQLSDLRSDYLRRVNMAAESNDIFGTLLPLMEAVCARLGKFLEDSLHSFERLHEFVLQNALELRHLTEENSGTAGGGEQTVGGAESGSVPGVSGETAHAGGSVAGGSSAEGSSAEGSSTGENGAGGEQQETIREAGINSDPSSEQEEELRFEGENFSEENIRLFVKIVERIIAQVGEDELNRIVERHYTDMAASRSIPSDNSAQGSQVSRTHQGSVSDYGRYTVTDQSIRMMAPVYAQTDKILERFDQFYKEKFRKLGESYEMANKTIHTMSSFIGLFGLGAISPSKMFDANETDKSIFEKITLSGVALANCTLVGKFFLGGASMLKILDWAMPYMKKSKMLVKLNEKVWNLTRQEMQLSPVNGMMDQYMMEHYEIKYGMDKGKSGWFPLYHMVMDGLDDTRRRCLENAVFSVDRMFILDNYMITETDPVKYWNIRRGLFLNLVRSGMCSSRKIDAAAANGIVDKLYDVYVTQEHLQPRVDLDPGKRTVSR